MTNCLHCHAPTENPKFCNRSCASSYNNKVKPKRQKTNRCRSCDTAIITNWTYCRACSPKFQFDWETVTLGEIQRAAKYQVSALVRNKARQVYRHSNKPKHCCNCGYSKFYEVCHIIPIRDHAPTTRICEVNDIRNLVGLCPNCHWELDHGHLKIKYPHLDSNQEPLVRTER